MAERMRKALDEIQRTGGPYLERTGRFDLDERDEEYEVTVLWELKDGYEVSGIREHEGRRVLVEHRNGCAPRHHW